MSPVTYAFVAALGSLAGYLVGQGIDPHQVLVRGLCAGIGAIVAVFVMSLVAPRDEGDDR